MRISEFLNGWKVLIVFNDVIFSVGLFGFKEDVYFKFMIDLVCCEKLFFIYFVVNLGVCIGVVEEVCFCFCIGWLDDFFFECGFKYFYFKFEDYYCFFVFVIVYEFKFDFGEVRWIIEDVIGKEDGLGVENFFGSGVIVGVFLCVYCEMFILIYVLG